MQLPRVTHTPKVREIAFCGDRVLGRCEETGKEIIFAENLDLSAMPDLLPRTAYTYFEGLDGKLLQFFCNGERAVAITLEGENYFAKILDAIEGRIVSLSLPLPREDAFLYAHAWRGDKLYLPAFCSVVDANTCMTYRTDLPLEGGYTLPEHIDELYDNNRHIIIFEGAEGLSECIVGEYVRVDYTHYDGKNSFSSFLKVYAVNAETGEITLEGENATHLLYAGVGTLKLSYDIPVMTDMIADHERAYGFYRNKIYISAKDSEHVRFSVLSTDQEDAYPKEIALAAEITGCCFYRGRPVFFTDGSVVTLEEDVELGFRVSIIPTVGVTPRAVTSPAVIGDRICYFSRYGLAVFDGTCGRVVRADIGEPSQGGAAVADGSFYSFVTARDGERAALYAYDAENDLLYCLGDASKTGVCFALGGVLIGSETDESGKSLLVLFADRNTLPYPISSLAGQGVIRTLPDERFESRLVFGDDREVKGGFGPFALCLDAAVGEEGSVCLALYYDDEREAAQEFLLEGALQRERRTFPVAPRRCRRYHIVLRAKGDFRVFGLSAQLRD